MILNFGNKHACNNLWVAGMPPHTCGSERVGESGFGNINLEQHARQDQVARVSRATVAEATTGAVGDRHFQTLRVPGCVGDDFETSLFGSFWEEFIWVRTQRVLSPCISGSSLHGLARGSH
jgi:hypothetical protein